MTYIEDHTERDNSNETMSPEFSWRGFTVMFNKRRTGGDKESSFITTRKGDIIFLLLPTVGLMMTNNLVSSRKLIPTEINEFIFLDQTSSIINHTHDLSGAVVFSDWNF